MEILVGVDRAEGLDERLERAAWAGVDGIELDITDLDEAEYRSVRDAVERHALPVRSIHYGRTETVSLTEWDLFRSQLDMLVDRAARFDCRTISVHPPELERETSNTVRDLQRFLVEMADYVDGVEPEICFQLAGFLKDPEMVNHGFAEVEGGVGVMVDFGTVLDGVDPMDLLEKMDVPVRKLKAPVEAGEMEAMLDGVHEDVTAVATAPDE